MEVLVLGATGKTGRLVVNQLLAQQISVRVIVRSAENFVTLLPTDLIKDSRLSVKEASILELSEQALQEQVKGCCAVISCLGHNMNLKGIYGQPKRLVTDSVKRICKIIQSSSAEISPVKFILMNTTGNVNSNAGEKTSLVQRGIVWLIRKLIPPHADNEGAAEYLQNNFFESDKKIAWSVIRPDSLIDEQNRTTYDIYPSPIRSAIFDAGTTSRINVANFMAALVTDSVLWAQWKTKMPVIYNRKN